VFSNEENESPVGRIVRRNRLKDSFGNLTLITKPLNSSISNGPFADKRAALEENSLLVLNRDIIKERSWDEDRIINRGRALFPIANSIWGMPKV
jgi:hypothetical protein